MIINEYDYLWTTEKADWVLVDSSYGYGIINKKSSAKSKKPSSSRLS